MPEQWEKGWEWYESLYRGAESHQILGEASNSYSANATYPETIERIEEWVKSPKFIYCVRHPAQRTESDWMERQRISDISFSEYLQTEDLYRDKNRYLHTYRLYSERFGVENIHVVIFDYLQNATAETVNGCLRFLDLPSLNNEQFHQVHRGSSEFTRPGRLFSAMRQVSLTETASRYISADLKRKVRAWMGTKVTIERPVWCEADRLAFEREWKEQTEEFLHKIGEDVSLWRW